MNATFLLSNVKHEGLRAWITEMATLCQPNAIHICDGSKAEYQQLCDQMVKSGTFIRLNPEKRPNSYLARSSPDDVARIEECTFICSARKEDAGPKVSLKGFSQDVCVGARCTSFRLAWDHLDLISLILVYKSPILLMLFVICTS